MQNECVFCKIVARKAPALILFQDELVTAFRDIHPLAPTHVLIVPNNHIVSVNDLSDVDELLAGRLLTVARKIAMQEGIDHTGYRLILNTGAHAGQAVFHLHVHILGGQRMRFPMG